MYSVSVVIGESVWTASATVGRGYPATRYEPAEEPEIDLADVFCEDVPFEGELPEDVEAALIEAAADAAYQDAQEAAADYAYECAREERYDCYGRW